MNPAAATKAGPSLHDPRPPVPHRLAGALLPAADPEPIDRRARETKKRRKQCDRREHGDEDRERRADGKAVQERQSHQEDAEHGDHHRDAGEHDRSTRMCSSLR